MEELKGLDSLTEVNPLNIDIDIDLDIDEDLLSDEGLNFTPSKDTGKTRGLIQDLTPYHNLEYTTEGKVEIKIDTHLKESLGFIKTGLPKDGKDNVLIAVANNTLIMTTGNTIVDVLTTTTCTSDHTFYFNIDFVTLETLTNRGNKLNINVTQDSVLISRERINRIGEDTETIEDLWTLPKLKQHKSQLEILKLMGENEVKDTLKLDTLNNALTYLTPTVRGENLPMFRDIIISKGNMFSRKPSAYLYFPMNTTVPYVITPTLSNALLHFTKLSLFTYIHIIDNESRYIFKAGNNMVIAKKPRIDKPPSLHKILGLEIENAIKIKSKEVMETIKEVVLGEGDVELSLTYHNNNIKVESLGVRKQTEVNLRCVSSKPDKFTFKIQSKMFTDFIKYLKSENLFIIQHKDNNFLTLSSDKRIGLRITLRLN